MPRPMEAYMRFSKTTTHQYTMTHANGHTPTEKPVLYIPSPLHPAAYTHAESLGFDLLLPDDPRVSHWEEITSAVSLRQGLLIGDLRKVSLPHLKGFAEVEGVCVKYRPLRAN